MLGMKHLLRPIRSTIVGVALVAAAIPIAAAAEGAGGVTGPAFYVNGTLYRTVGTPTDFSDTGAPAHSYDIIYAFPPNTQQNVATSAPGLPGYNGGRWEVHALSFKTSYAATLAAHDANSSGTLDSAAEVAAALADTGSTGATDLGVVRRFECPVIKVPASA